MPPILLYCFIESHMGTTINNQVEICLVGCIPFYCRGDFRKSHLRGGTAEPGGILQLWIILVKTLPLCRRRNRLRWMYWKSWKGLKKTSPVEFIH
jgi:hypothetical protein